MTTPPQFPYTIREYGFTVDFGRLHFLFTDDTTRKAHPDYRAAKVGDQAAAVNVVWDIAAKCLVKVVAQLKGVLWADGCEATGNES